MPRHSDFEKLYRGMIKQYGKEKGERVYYSFLNKHKLDDTKPMPSKLPSWAETTTEIMDLFSGRSKLLETEERFDWLDESIKLEGNVIRGHAIHADIPTANKVTYTEDELRHAARTLKGKRLFLNHLEDSDQAREYLKQKGSVLDPEVYDLITRIARRGDPALGEVVDAEYVNSDTRAVEYAARIDDPDALRLMKAGKVIGVSVGAVPRRTIEQNGALPVGVFFEDLSLVTAPERPGDPEATVKLWEKLREMAKEQEYPPDPYAVTPEGKLKKPGQFTPGEVTVNAEIPSAVTAGNEHTATQVGSTLEESNPSEKGGSNMPISKEDLEAINKGIQETLAKMKHQDNGEEEDTQARMKSLEEAFKGLKNQLDELAGKLKSFEAAMPTPPTKQEETKEKQKETAHREGIIGVPGQEPDFTGQGETEAERPLATFSGVMSRLTGRKQ